MPLNLVDHGAPAPSGEDLEYEKVFTDLLLAARPEEERQVGNAVQAGAEPDAKKIADHAEAVLGQSHDLRAAVLYGYAGTRLRGLPGLAEATGYIRGCLEQFWDTCHPQLDADDDNDPTMRINAVLGLVEPATVLRAVRGAPLTESPAFGRMSLTDIAIAEGEMSAPEGMDNPPDAARVSAAFRDTPEDALRATLDAARAALADVEAIDAVFNERTPGQGPELAPLVKLLRRATTRLSEVIGDPEPAPEEDTVDDTEGAPAAARPARAGGAGEIASSRDVEQAIDRIIKYYREHEPSSPVPMILARAKRLVGADFMTIVADMAPGGQDTVRMISGTEDG